MKKLKIIKAEVAFWSKVIPNVTANSFNFLTEAAELVVFARRALSMTFITRYFI